MQVAGVWWTVQWVERCAGAWTDAADIAAALHRLAPVTDVRAALCRYTYILGARQHEGPPWWALAALRVYSAWSG